MTNNFSTFADAVANRLKKMGNLPRFKVDVDGIFGRYLDAFPRGTNPIYKERTEHDCECCKSFLKNIGDVVALTNTGDRITCWDVGDVPYPYNMVSKLLQALILNAPIKSAYASDQAKYGAKTTNQLLVNGNIKTWDHFYGAVPRVSDPNSFINNINTGFSVLKHSLTELKLDAIDQVIELIENNNLYRGEEHLNIVKAYSKLKSEAAFNDYIWAKAHTPEARFKNTVIGTLVTDLSKGVELEDAVRMFESKVAPNNYKRSKALITPRMVEQATHKLKVLGLEGAVDRRHARETDVSIKDILFADSSIAPKMKDSPLNVLMTEAKRQSPAKKRDGKVIHIGEFISDVLPKARTLDLFLNYKLLSNFMSVTAPVGENVGRLFQWENDFAWSYDGEVADSVTQRVKKAGGNVDVSLRVSLAWHNTDDLDIHAECPDGHIYFGNQKDILDVDMNAGSLNLVRDAVENLSWTNPRIGKYKIYVNNYAKREDVDVGFTIELAHNGLIEQYHCAINPNDRSYITCLNFDYNEFGVKNLTVGPNLTNSGVSTVEKWGLNTNQYVPVNMVMRSPNHWGRAVGNQHMFFILEGCKNPDPVRGIYNEFLRPELHDHRKVFEVLGQKSKAPYCEEQLSGVGFSSTKRASFNVLVNGGQAYNVEVGS